MSFNKPIRRIAIVGTGVIGASWATHYLARGFDVVATDPGPNAEENLYKYVEQAWGQAKNLGLTPGASRDRLSFTANMHEALANADFVQGSVRRIWKSPSVSFASKTLFPSFMSTSVRSVVSLSNGTRGMNPNSGTVPGSRPRILQTSLRRCTPG
jgi:hypothetical protein